MTRAELVELVADYFAEHQEGDDPTVAAQALLRDLHRVHGLAVVPREPTEEMISHLWSGEGVGREVAKGCLRRAIGAGAV